MKRFLPLLLIALQFTVAGIAHAEKADSQKPYNVSADNMVDDDVKQIRTWTGNVILIQGTMILKGTKLVVTTSPDNYDFATLYAPAGGRATMRQKRDGGPDLWMEGEATDRITYDQKTSIVKLFANAKLRRLTGAKPTDEATGAFLSYNSQTEIVTGANTEAGDSKPGAGRVIVVIQPHPAPKDK
ncbi:MAG: lipopolysaccharide transport periplasmic protein LptA [Burkholderiales bacterium]